MASMLHILHARLYRIVVSPGLAVLETLERLPEGRSKLGENSFSKLTPERAEIIVAVLRDGKSFYVAAMRAGISYRTFAKWREKAREKVHPAYVAFHEACEHAIAEAEEDHLANVQDAAYGTGRYEKPTWQASAWWLERVRKEIYGRSTKHVHEGSDGGPIKFTLKIGDRDIHPPDEIEKPEATEADWEYADGSDDR